MGCPLEEHQPIPGAFPGGDAAGHFLTPRWCPFLTRSEAVTIRPDPSLTAPGSIGYKLPESATSAPRVRQASMPPKEGSVDNAAAALPEAAFWDA